ncbi:uncharacterized protein N7484_009210 [Penicillium longicatenatum]|uniref:uncharacterized protein n=1 Tax=Penicillium longicatenatum TaxID=1561947 RepID=UPI00254870EA|nr:uncharacterized protein N7484_009210 [Penicillium longicatenatum]KAJ5635897.1 hypothetical protein N7484_009210 [Penicillium longicatenatum]
MWERPLRCPFSTFLEGPLNLSSGPFLLLMRNAISSRWNRSLGLRGWTTRNHRKKGFIHSQTSGILDLFTADEIDILVSDRQFSHGRTIPPHLVGDDSAALDVAFAIGNQARGLNNDMPLSEAYFSRACTIAFKDALMSQTLGKTRLFVLLAFYTLSSCNRNSAAMFLAIAAKAAVILDLESSQEGRIPGEDLSTRKRVWSSLRNLDILSSFIIGRPKNLPPVKQNAAKLQASNDRNFESSQSTFMAMIDACALLEGIVGTLGKSNNILHVPTAEGFLQQLRQWSRGLPPSVRQFKAPSLQNPNLEPADRQSLMGSMHVSCVYYFAVTLITRPFLVAYLTSRLRGKAPDHLISDPDQASDMKLKNNKVSRLAQVCVSSAINMVDMCIKAKGINFTFGNFCLIEAWLFGAGLVLGFSMFAGEPRRDIEDSFQNTCIILADIALTSQQALLYHNILISFAEAVTKYRQRVTDEMHYAVQHYMDRILMIETTNIHSTDEQIQTTSNRDVRNPWENCLAGNFNLHPETDPRTLLQMPSFQDQHEDWAGADLQFLDYFSPELEPFDQLFYTVE